MSACRARRPRRSEPKLSNAARTNACQCRRDAGWPGKVGAHRALAVRFRRSHHAPRSWPFAGGGSARVSRPPGRRSSSSQCGSTAATAPRRGRPQACRPTALDGAPGALVRAAWPPGRPVGCRGARRRERTSTGTRACPMPGCRSPPVPIAAQVAGPRAAGVDLPVALAPPAVRVPPVARARRGGARAGIPVHAGHACGRRARAERRRRRGGRALAALAERWWDETAAAASTAADVNRDSLLDAAEMVALSCGWVGVGVGPAWTEARVRDVLRGCL